MPGIVDMSCWGAGAAGADSGPDAVADMSMPGMVCTLAAGLGVGLGAGAGGVARLGTAALALGAGAGLVARLGLATGLGLAAVLAGMVIPGMFMFICAAAGVARAMAAALASRSFMPLPHLCAR